MSNEIVTTVVTPAVSYDLTDLETVKDDIGLTGTGDDAFLQRAITQASKAAANYCNRIFPAETVKDLIYIDRNALLTMARNTIQLSRFPVVSISSVIENAGQTDVATLASGTDYLSRNEPGQVLRLNAAGSPTAWTARTVTVQYQTGFATIPEDIAEAALRLVTMRYKQKGKDPMLVSSSQPGGPAGGLGDRRWWVGPLPGQDGAFPPEIAGLLDNYRVPAFA